MLRTRLDLIEVSYVLISSQTAKMNFVGNAIIRNSWLRGPITGVFNSSFIGNWDCAPRAHPNDSKLDVVSIDQSMNLRQRLTAKRLVKLGSHLPHPKISYKQTESFKIDLQEPAHLFVDSIDLGMVRQCDFRVISDALSLYW
jgi:diacylglycerol kinase family enzyme